MQTVQLLLKQKIVAAVSSERLLFIHLVTCTWRHNSKSVVLICAILLGINTFLGNNSSIIFFGKHNSFQIKQRFSYFYCFHISVTLNLHIQETITI